MSSFDPGARLLLLARVGSGEVITQQDGGHIPTILIDLLTGSVQGNGDRREESVVLGTAQAAALHHDRGKALHDKGLL